MNFYPRPPRGGRPDGQGQRPGAVEISIHALREEGDGRACDPVPRERNFYPRPPRGGRLMEDLAAVKGKKFLSTPSARRATTLRMQVVKGQKFLSTPSARRATRCGDSVGLDQVFLSTPSARRATEAGRMLGASDGISIHALREEGDGDRRRGHQKHQDFYPRPPRGGRPSGSPTTRTPTNFYPRPPRGGRP